MYIGAMTASRPPKAIAPRRARVAATSLAALLLVGGCAYFQDTQSQMEEAETALAEGDEAKAEQLYREVMRNKKSRDSEDARRALVSLLLQRAARMMETDSDSAMPIYRDVISLKPDSDEARIAYARALMKVERYTEAVDVLMEDKGCRGCKSLISVIYIESGNTNVRDGNYSEALEDYDLALSVNRDPLTVLAKVDTYTVGEYGTATDAYNFLDQALRLMPADQIGVQQVWWDKRQQVIYAAALRGEHDKLTGILELPDPRARVEDGQKKIDILNLRMYAASLQIYVKAYDLGTARGMQTFEDAEGQLSGEPLEALRKTLLGLYMQRIAAHVADGDTKQAIAMSEQALELDPTDRTLNLQHVIATAMRNSGSGRKLLADWEADPEYNRMRALVETAYALKMMGIGQFASARAATEKAERYAPELLETHLARAELQAETRFEGLRKSWAETFREMDQFNYPKARINHYGHALAELRVVQSLYTEEAARDYLRGPQVASRIQALDERIKAFYPFEAQLGTPGEAVIVLTRVDSPATKVSVKGPRQVHEVEVPENGQVELKLKMPGLALVGTAAGGEKAVFAEPGVKIFIPI